jgi:polar amino acid transport system substrate-binding protein
MHIARNTPRRHRSLAWILPAAVLSVAMQFVAATSANAATLDRIRQAGKATFGFRADARPFSLAEGSSPPAGFSIAICEKVADEIKADLGISDLAVTWVPVTLEDRFTAVAQGTVDLLCDSSSVTLERREQVSFSIPIYPSGIAAMMRADSSKALQDVLLGLPPSGPIWRASPAQIITGKTFSVVSGTTGETWLAERLQHFKIAATVAPVESYAAGVQQVLDRTADVFFGERPVLVEAAANSPSPGDLIILDRRFTTEPVALALARNDDDFRLVVDRALSALFPTPEFRDLYTKWFGAPDETIVTFIRQSALPN